MRSTLGEGRVKEGGSRRGVGGGWRGRGDGEQEGRGGGVWWRGKRRNKGIIIILAELRAHRKNEVNLM